MKSSKFNRAHRSYGGSNGLADAKKGSSLNATQYLTEHLAHVLSLSLKSILRWGLGYLQFFWVSARPVYKDVGRFGEHVGENGS